MTSPIRSTMRVNGNFLNPGEASSAIYYLKTSMPHLHDFSVFGPFHCLEALVPSLRHKLSGTSPLGLQMFDDLMQSPGGISSFERLVAPLDGGHEFSIQLVKIYNPEVAASLPGPAWTVLWAELLPEPSHSKGMQLKSLEIVGVHTSAHAANGAGRQILAEKLGGMTGARMMEQQKDDGTIGGVVMNSRTAGMLEVKFDSGEQTYPSYQ